MDHAPTRIDGCTLCSVQARFNTRLPHFPTLRLELNGSSLHVNPLEKTELIQYTHFLRECISDLDQAVYLLNEQRQKLALEESAYCNLLSPMLQMPTEIHHLIFRYCVDDWVSHSITSNIDYPDYWMVPPRRVLTQICQSWRNTALASPDLWCDIDVKDYLFFNGYIPLYEDLSRSKGLPLRIFYSTRIRDKDEEDIGVSHDGDVFDVLAQTRHLWVSFHAGHHLGDICRFLVQPDNIPKFPMLKYISGDFGSYLFDRKYDESFASNMPLLSRMDVIAKYSLPEGTKSFPWFNLRHLRFSHGPQPMVANLLTQVAYPCLTRLELVFADRIWQSETSSSDEPILLPLVDTLKIFHVRDMGDGAPLEIVSRLRLPSLSTLVLSKLDDFRCVMEMLEATESSAPLWRGVQVLELESIFYYRLMAKDPHSFPFSSLFRLLPCLKALSVHSLHRAICDELLRSLALNSEFSNSTLCRALERVSMFDVDVSPWSLEQFLLSRLKAEERKLTHLVVDSSYLLSETPKKQEIDKLKSAVLNFSLPPCARLRIDFQYRLGPDFDEFHRLYYSGVSKAQ